MKLIEIMKIKSQNLVLRSVLTAFLEKAQYLCLIVFLLMFSCAEEIELTPDLDETASPEQTSTTSERYSFKNWKEFHELYLKFAKIQDAEELKAVSFYRPDNDSGLSPAIQGILNERNEFEVNGQVIWYSEGKFYELESDKPRQESQRTSTETLKVVGSITNTLVSPESINSRVNLGLNGHTNSFQKEFRKQRYVERCGTGIVQGPSPRAFKFVNELYSEYLVTGFQSNYSLYLRVKLEYNHKRRRWRLSGEGREISIDVSDASVLRRSVGPAYPDRSGNPFPYRVRFNSNCASHQTILLRWYYDIAPVAYGTYWDASAGGTITQKMVGDVENNRWRNSASW